MRLIIAAVLIFSMPSAKAFSPQNFSIEKYVVKIEPNFSEKSIVGSTEIVVGKMTQESIEFPLYGLSIDSVSADGKSAAYSSDQSRLKIDLSKKRRRIPSTSHWK